MYHPYCAYYAEIVVLSERHHYVYLGNGYEAEYVLEPYYGGKAQLRINILFNQQAAEMYSYPNPDATKLVDSFTIGTYGAGSRFSNFVLDGKWPAVLEFCVLADLKDGQVNQALISVRRLTR